MTVPRPAKVAAAIGAVKLRADQSWALMTDDVEIRRRRAIFRAHHRGTKEMDLLMGRFAEARVAAMAPEALARFERLLLVPDPLVQDMILHPEIAPAGEHAELIGQLRLFHGLEG
jgi:antitoxin CptB